MRIFTICLLFCASFAHAQTHIFKATAAQSAALKKQAEASASALAAQNYKQMVYYTYPKIIEAMGGADKMQEKFVQSMSQLQSMGVAIKSVTVGNVSPITKSGHDLYSVVQDIVQISNNGTIVTASSYLLAFSSNNGLRWYFVDSTPLRKQNVKKMFPTYPDGLVIPVTRNPLAPAN